MLPGERDGDLGFCQDIGKLQRAEHTCPNLSNPLHRESECSVGVCSGTKELHDPVGNQGSAGLLLWLAQTCLARDGHFIVVRLLSHDHICQASLGRACQSSWLCFALIHEYSGSVMCYTLLLHSTTVTNDREIDSFQQYKLFPQGSAARKTGIKVLAGPCSL